MKNKGLFHYTNVGKSIKKTGHFQVESHCTEASVSNEPVAYLDSVIAYASLKPTEENNCKAVTNFQPQVLEIWG